MKMRTGILTLVAFALIAAQPAWAQRSHSSYGGSHGGHGHAGSFRHHHSWGPFGFLLGTAILYSALQPRPAYYASPVVYAPPRPVPAPAVYVEQITVPPARAAAAPPRLAQNEQWWYFCSKPAGYYPYIRACPGGWDRVPPTPPGAIR